MTAVVRIVSRVGTGGATVLDLNRHAAGIMLGRGHNLAEVAERQASGEQPIVWSSPAEVTELASRQITVPLVLFSGTANGVALLMQQVRQATAGRFVLQLQRHGSTVPVWLRCAAGSLAVERSALTGREDTTVVQATLTAQTEPYALGARVDVGPATVTQDPAAGTPFVWDITVGAGDALTPLVIRTNDSDLLSVSDRTLISVRRRGTPTALSGLWVQAEGASITPGTAAPTVTTLTGDSAMSDGSAVRATYTPSASGPWTLTRTFASLAGVEAPGQYRLLVRVRRGGAAAGQLFSLVAKVGAARLVETVTAGGSDIRVVDLGLVQVPTGQPPFMAAPEGPVEASAPTVDVAVVRAAAGDGTFDVDWIALVPADQDCGMLEVAQGQAGALVLDGWDQAVRCYSADPYSAGAQAVSTGGLTWIGGMPRLRPGVNRLYVVAGLGIGTGSDRAVGLSLSLSGSYWPRYSWLA